MRYAMSKIIPVPMRSRYGVELGGKSFNEKASWIQWRGRIFAHKVSAA